MSEPTDAGAGFALPPEGERRPTARRNPARGMLLLTITSGVFIVSGYAITVWLAHELGPTDFGRYSVVVAITTLVNIVVARGVPVAATRAIAADPEAAERTMDAAWRATIPLSIGTAALAAAAAVPLAAVLGDDALAVPLLVGAGAALTYGLQALLLAWFTGMHRYGRQAFAQSWYAVSRVVTIIGGGFVAGLTGAVAGFVVAPVIGALATLRRVGRRRTESSSRRASSRSAPTARTLLQTSAPLVGVAALVAALLSIDLLAFKRVGTATDVGRYAAAAAIAHVPFFLLRSAPLVVMPAVAAALSAASKSPEGKLPAPVRVAIRRGVGDAVVLLALPTALIVALGDEALELVFGTSYAVDGLLVAPLALATAAVTLYSVLVAVETALGTLRVALATGAVGLAFVATAAAIGGQGSNPSRAAWGVAVAATLTFLAHAAFVWARAGSFVPPRAVAATALAVAVGAVTLAAPPGAAWVATSALAACVAYGAVALRTGLMRLR
ncbi:MAG: lipopolysaccharide biosynthesis protein [Gaiellaceae bacterium]